MTAAAKERAEERVATPSIGRIVHYIVSLDGETHRPAIITDVRDDGTVDLTVFTTRSDGVLPYGAGCSYENSNVYAERRSEGTTLGTWHWPERD